MKSPDLTRRATIACIAVLVAGSALGFLDGRLGLGSRMQPDLHIIAMSAAQRAAFMRGPVPTVRRAAAGGISSP